MLARPAPYVSEKDKREHTLAAGRRCALALQIDARRSVFLHAVGFSADLHNLTNKPVTFPLTTCHNRMENTLGTRDRTEA